MLTISKHDHYFG